MYFDSFPTVPYDAIGNGNPKAGQSVVVVLSISCSIPGGNT